MQQLVAGTTIAGKYRLESLIGRGGMGAVWRARHLQWSAPVAVKLLDAPVVGSADEPADADRVAMLMQRFFSEARAAAAIRSPHVVQIIDHGVDHSLGIPYIVMELLEGETLEQRLRSGPLSVATAERILTHVARALARLHDAGCVHRDLKPSNVFLVANEEEIIAKVLDFGIVKMNLPALEPTPLTRTGEQMGTPYYMSPEQIRGLRNIDFRADIWALGVLGFECLVGKRPFDGETMGDLSLKICADPIAVPSQFGRVPDGFDAWFLRCVERQRERTFGSARDAIEALRGVLVVNAAGEAPSARIDDRKAASAVSSTGSSVGPSGQRPSHWPRWMWWVPALLVAALGLRLALRQHDAAPEHTVSGSQPAATSFSNAAPSSEPKRSANQNEQQGPTASAPEPAPEARSAAESKPKQADLRAPRGRPVRSNAPPAAPTASAPSSVGSARSSTGPARDLIEDRL